MNVIEDGVDFCASEVRDDEKTEVVFYAYSTVSEYLPASQPLVELKDCPGEKVQVERSLLWDGKLFEVDSLNRSSPCFAIKTFHTLASPESSDLVGIMSEVEGPWAIIYYSRRENSIWFGKDSQGQRSLLLGLAKGPNDGTIAVIAPVAVRHPELTVEWVEIDTRGLYQLDIGKRTIKLHPWPDRLSRPFCTELRQCVAPALRPDQDMLDSSSPVEDLLRLLRDAVGSHFVHRGKQKKCFTEDVDGCVGILFSGGLDSTILAAIADLELPQGYSIDLINVSFGNDESEIMAAPDRRTSIESYRALCDACPDRRWRLVLVNVSKSELQTCLPHIASLAYPNNSAMDISISAPLWFASRSLGVTSRMPRDPMDGVHQLVPYTTRPDVFLLGTGADEQFGGYSRHRICYLKSGWQGLRNELSKDILRLWKRNLGRDDRVLGDHNRRRYFPYLDARLMRWIGRQKLSDLVDMNLPAGEGDKYLLRQLAKVLGLHGVSTLPKVAIQFGSRAAKQMPKQKGTDLFVL